MAQDGVTVTCPGCGMVLPEEQTPVVCELCGQNKATSMLAKMDEDSSLMSCEPCLMALYAKAAMEVAQQAGAVA